MGHPIHDMNAIELDCIVKRFGEATVLQDLYLKIPEGSFSVLLGASGSGKTTLARIIAGLEQPTSGRVMIFGNDQKGVSPHQRQLAMVFQNGNAYEHLTVLQNLKFVPRDIASKSGRHAADATASSVTLDQVIEELELRELLQLKPPQLSGGQQQRLAIARAIASNRRIWIFDEPLAHLDESVRQQIRTLLIEMQRRHRITVLYVTHDSDEAMQLATHIGVMHHGAIEQFGAPEEVYDSPVSIDVGRALGQPPMELVASIDVHGHAVQAGIRPIDWRMTNYISGDVGGDRSGSVVSNAYGIEMSGIVRSAKYMGRQWWVWLESRGCAKPILVCVPCIDDGCDVQSRGRISSGGEASASRDSDGSGSNSAILERLFADCRGGRMGGVATFVVPHRVICKFDR